MRANRLGPALTLSLTILGLAAPLQAEEAGWRVVRTEHGVKVSSRDEPGHQVASFRGEGEVSGDILHVLAIVLDDGRAKEWARGADESKILRALDPRTHIVYSRSKQTWPVQDRDLVMKRTVDVLKQGEQYRVRLVCVEGEKEKLASVVRIRDCETLFVLRKVDTGRTFVEFRVRADPGGNSPDWIVRWASKSIPLDTLVGLRKQIQKTRGRYDREMARWNELL